MYFIRDDSMAALEYCFVFNEKKKWRETEKNMDLRICLI